MYKCLRPFTEHFYNNFLMCSSVTFFFDSITDNTTPASVITLHHS